MSHRDDAEVLFANECFYTAFSSGDSEAMSSLWGKEGAVTCLHPGWEPLLDRNNILASWNAILQAPPTIKFHAPTLISLGQDGAVVFCWEEIESTFIMATNAFRRETDGWKIAHHQAGPAAGSPPQSDRSTASSDIPN